MEAYDILELKANEFMKIISQLKYYEKINDYLGGILSLQNAELKNDNTFHNVKIAPVSIIEEDPYIYFILPLIYRNKIGYLFL